MNSLTQDEYAYLCVLLQQIDSCDWKSLEDMIRTYPRKFIAVSEAISKSSELNGMSILHSAIRFNPPPKIVKLIVRLCPSSPSSVDCLNRTPLHIAAAIRANPKSIMALIKSCEEACAVQDVDGKTPLHFACDVYCELFEGDEGIIRDPPSMDVIQRLALASPESIPYEDRDEMSALEYAILSNADLTLVKFLMRLTRIQLSGEESPNSRFEQVPRSIEFFNEYPPQTQMQPPEMPRSSNLQNSGGIQTQIQLSGKSPSSRFVQVPSSIDFFNEYPPQTQMQPPEMPRSSNLQNPGGVQMQKNYPCNLPILTYDNMLISHIEF